METTMKSTGNKRLDWWIKFNAMRKSWHATQNSCNSDSYNWYANEDLKENESFDHLDESLSAWEKQEVLCSLYL